MASRRPTQLPQPAKPSSRVAKEKRRRAVGARVDVMRSGAVRTSSSDCYSANQSS
jgi:hypothetical protein